MEQLKLTQVDGVKYKLTKENAAAEHLLKKGLRLENKLKSIKTELDEVKSQLIEIAKNRREDQQTTINIGAVSGKITITFRESYNVKDIEGIKDCKSSMGSLFDDLFTIEETCKPKAKLNKFMSGKDTFGMKEYEAIKNSLSKYLELKSTKPSVQFKNLNK